MSLDRDPGVIRARALFLAICTRPPGARAMTVVIPGRPVSKVRHRTGNGHAYSDPQMVADEERTGSLLAARVRGRLLTGNVGLVAIFYRPTAQLVDADNLVKHVCDAGNTMAWVDDSQITTELGIIELDRVRPRTVVVFGDVTSTMERGGPPVRRKT